MKSTLIATAVISAIAATSVYAGSDLDETHHSGMPLMLAQAGTPPSGQAQPMGPGMMRGQGYGSGMMGQGYGQGMMGQGYGSGMMGYGMGPGMMGQGYGQGMMGHGMGPGMMGQGYGHGMMGPGMMAGTIPYAALDLTNEQRAKIADIQEGLWRKHWELMGKMHEGRFHMHRETSGSTLDEAGARKAYAAMAEAHKQMFEASLDARKRIEAVLTPAQREKLKRGG